MKSGATSAQPHQTYPAFNFLSLDFLFCAYQTCYMHATASFSDASTSRSKYYHNNNVWFRCMHTHNACQSSARARTPRSTKSVRAKMKQTKICNFSVEFHFDATGFILASCVSFIFILRVYYGRIMRTVNCVSRYNLWQI